MITADNRVQYFDLKELEEDREYLKLSDFKTLLGPFEDGYEINSLLNWQTVDHILTITSQSKAEKIFRFTVYDSNRKYH